MTTLLIEKTVKEIIEILNEYTNEIHESWIHNVVEEDVLWNRKPDINEIVESYLDLWDID